MPIVKMKLQDALDKYQPSIVILSDMLMNQDITSIVRAHGCVREYITIGMANTYAEGHGWDTWGHIRYRPKDASIQPAFEQEGWTRYDLNHISRWLLHKNDSELQMGNGVAVAFTRKLLTAPAAVKMRWRLQRLRPFY
jgi:hypothetical protein